MFGSYLINAGYSAGKFQFKVKINFNLKLQDDNDCKAKKCCICVKVLKYCSGAQVKSVSNQGNLIFCLVNVYKRVQSGCDDDHYCFDNDYDNTHDNVSSDF